MAGVPQKTLSWLYDVLRREYRDPNRAYSDLAQTLSQFPGLAPRTDVYTSENGVPALLLNLKGTIPVTFKGTTYRFPIAVWVPHAYPYEAPILYVTPTEGMVVRQGQHVSGADGRIYHHYLARWAQSWDKSNIVEFLRTLAEVFAREPPVVAKPMGATPQAHQNQGPPPVPPPPDVQQRYGSPQPANTVPGGPPRPPPKQPSAGQDSSQPVSGTQTARPGRYDAPPPLPSQSSSQHQRPQSANTNGSFQQSPAGMQYIPQRQDSRSYQMPPGQQHGQQYQTQSLTASSASPTSYQQQNYQTQYQHPPQPYSPSQSHQQPPHPPPPPQQRQHPTPTHASPQPHHPQPPPQQQPSYQPQGRSHSVQYQQPPQIQATTQQQQRQALVQPKPASPPDLLTSGEDPFQLALTTRPSHSSVPAPPIPVNPEKTALLSAISTQILTHLHSSIHQTQASYLPSLYSQHAALQSANATLRSELNSLSSLKSNLESNVSSLQSTLNSSNQLIASLKTPNHPNSVSKIPQDVSEVIIPPTVIARQLYDNVAEQRGYEAAIYALNEAVVRGRVGGDVWGRKVREMAREEFRRKWMVKKVGTALGLDDVVITGGTGHSSTRPQSYGGGGGGAAYYGVV